MSPDLPAKCHDEAPVAVGPQPEPVSADLDLVLDLRGWLAEEKR
jgi:hypothetical protein